MCRYVELTIRYSRGLIRNESNQRRRRQGREANRLNYIFSDAYNYSLESDSGVIEVMN